MENAIAQILEQIYEPKFYNESFGFRWLLPGCEEVTYRFESVKYNTNETLEYVKRGTFFRLATEHMKQAEILHEKRITTSFVSEVLY